MKISSSLYKCVKFYAHVEYEEEWSVLYCLYFMVILNLN